MDARQVERPIPEMTKTEALDRRIKMVVQHVERLQELNGHFVNVLDSVERKLAAPLPGWRDGICPTCGRETN